MVRVASDPLSWSSAQVSGTIHADIMTIRLPLSYCPRSSLPADVLAWLARRLAHLTPPRPAGQGGTPPLALEVRLDEVAAVIMDGLSYPRAGRMVGISKTEVGDSVVWGAGYSDTSCDLRILMDQPTEPISSYDASSRPDGRWFGGPERGACPKARCGRWPL